MSRLIGPACAAALAVLVWMAAAGAAEALLASDDFGTNIPPDDGLGPNWQVTGLWYVDAGRAISDLDGTDRAELTGKTCVDCRVEASVDGFGVPEVGLFLRQSGTSRYELVLLTNGNLRIRRIAAGVVTVLGEAASGIPDLSEPAKLSLTAVGKGPVQLNASVGGVARLSATDSTPGALSSAGTAGLFTTSAGVWFAAFRLYAEQGATAGDAGTDGGSLDAGVDAGPPDAGTDAGSLDAGVDGGSPDAGSPPDAGTGDAGVDGGAPPPDGGSDAGVTAQVLFGDDFAQDIAPDDGLGPNWDVSGLWYVNARRAISDLDGTDQALENKVSCADCRVEARVVGFGVPEVALSLRAATARDRYDLVLLGSGVLRIRRVRAGVATTLAEGPSGIASLSDWATLSLQATGAAAVQLVASVNGIAKVTATDASASRLPSSGSAGLWTLNAGVAFASFQLIGNAVTPVIPPGVNDEWPLYRHDVAGSANSGEGLTAAQARGLTLAWETTFPGGSDANPIVSGGILYLVGGDSVLAAFNARTGQRLWQQPIGASVLSSCVPFSNGPVGAAAVVGNLVYAPGGNGTVYAFDKSTGAPIWSTAIADTAKNEYLWSSIFPLEGRLYLGVATLFEPKCGPVPGKVVSLDGATGTVLGTLWADANHGPGGGVWTQPAWDARTRRLFLTTGTVADKIFPPNQPLAQAFVAVDPLTLQTLDSYQPVPANYIEEFDFGASPSLVDTADGRHLIIAANKNGIVYAADRDRLAAGILWTMRISGPGASPDIGESTIVSGAVANGLFFVGGGMTADGYPGAIAAVDPATGFAKWLVHPDGFVLPGLAAVGEVVIAGVSHAADSTGKLYVLEQQTGALLFSSAFPGRLFAEPTWAEGMLFVVDDRGTVRAFKR